MNKNYITPVILTIGFLVFQILIASISSYNDVFQVKPLFSGIHLSFSLFTLASVTTITSFSHRYSFSQNTRQSNESRNFVTNRLKSQKQFERIAFISLVSVFILLVSGTIVTNTTVPCTTWPICGGSITEWNLSTWLNNTHRLLVLVSAVLISVLNIYAWKKYKNNTTVLTSATAALVLFFAQSLLGVKMVEDFPLHLILVHQAAAVSVWLALVILNVTIGWGVTQDEVVYEKKPFFSNLMTRSKDFIKLTKPIVVLLLLVTTFAGMVIAGSEWPPANIAFWTLLAGFFAAGGSGAINQYIDRYDDLKMQRTQKRPIPSGRISPAEGLAFGVAAAVASFFIMTAYVNFLAALLTLAGIIYYVLIYSVILKKATVQNIVIGGGAGAIPPLIGWAAVTQSLNIPSLFLFAIIFVWTPPHFWALALVRKKDYARAGVPMMPVVRGEKETRRQIFIYTIELVALTLLLPLFGLGGSIYLIGAAILGVWLISTAWKVWKVDGNRVAWKMYRYSSMYLAFIFFVLMVDRLL